MARRPRTRPISRWPLWGHFTYMSHLSMSMLCYVVLLMSRLGICDSRFAWIKEHITFSCPLYEGRVQNCTLIHANQESRIPNLLMRPGFPPTNSALDLYPISLVFVRRNLSIPFVSDMNYVEFCITHESVNPSRPFHIFSPFHNVQWRVHG